MSAIKDNDRKTWRSYIRYTDWQGKNQIHTKRGFKTKREALAYEREFLMKKTRDINMGFSMTSHMHRLILELFRISLAQFLIMRVGFTTCRAIHQSKQGKWGRPRQRKCCFGQKKNT